MIVLSSSPVSSIASTHAADLVIGVLDGGAEDLHPVGADLLVDVGDLVPRRGAPLAVAPLGVGGDDPALLLPRQDVLAELVVTVIELAAVPLDESPGTPTGGL